MQIIPITELRNTSKIDEMCSLSNDPVFITKNGYGAMVLMSMKTYNEKVEEKEVLLRLVNAMNGKTLDGDAVFRELSDKYGL